MINVPHSGFETPVLFVWLLDSLQGVVQDVLIKMEPDGEVEIQSYPVLKKLAVILTDCRAWLEGRDFLSLGEKSALKFSILE